MSASAWTSAAWMAEFVHKLGRRRIYFTDHALDRWWDRCRANRVKGRSEALSLLRSSLNASTWKRDLPEWTSLSLWHQATAEGFIYITPDSGFVVRRNPNRDRVAVSYIERLRKAE